MKYAILHGLDINAHNNQPFETSIQEYECLLEAMASQYPDSTILVCGLPDVTNRERARATNFCVKQITYKYRSMIFVDTSGLRLHDGVHYAKHAKNLLVERLMNQMDPACF